MADYIYMLESRMAPAQQKAITLVQETARAHGMNAYLTGGAIRDMISGFPIRDIDLTLEGNPLKIQRDLEKAGAVVEGEDEELHEQYVRFPGNVRASINMARSERYGKPGKPPEIGPAAIMEDLRRRDFTVNAMALSLNPGSRGLLLDPTNGVADIEAKLVRILHNYSLLEDPSRMIRATRFVARFHWTMDERTQSRYNAAVENGYLEYISDKARGREAEQIGYEDDPLPIMRALEKEGWLKILHAHWSVAKADAPALGQLLKNRQQMSELGYTVDVAPAVLYFITARMNEHDLHDLQKRMPRKALVKAWHNLEDEAKELARQLMGKEAATPSRAWQLLTRSRPETIIFLETTARQQAAVQKIRNYLGKWRQVKQRFPLPEMGELRITPEHPEYKRLVEEMFLLMLDGKLRNSGEIIKYLKPYAPPEPPPPPPPKRGRAAKAEPKKAEVAAAVKGKVAEQHAVAAAKSADQAAKKKLTATPKVAEKRKAAKPKPKAKSARKAAKAARKKKRK